MAYAEAASGLCKTTPRSDKHSLPKIRDFQQRAIIHQSKHIFKLTRFLFPTSLQRHQGIRESNLLHHHTHPCCQTLETRQIVVLRSTVSHSDRQRPYIFIFHSQALNVLYAVFNALVAL